MRNICTAWNAIRTEVCGTNPLLSMKMAPKYSGALDVVPYLFPWQVGNYMQQGTTSGCYSYVDSTQKLKSVSFKNRGTTSRTELHLDETTSKPPL